MGALLFNAAGFVLIPGISWLSRTSGAKRRQSEFHSWVSLAKAIALL